ncbi:MAG: Ty3/Gypsy family RNase HI domain-containing protein [Arsenophonus sp. NC-PG7-MAG3]
MTFNLIKGKFLETIMLHHPNFNKPFFMNCDASNISLGAELYQEDEDGDHLVIRFASRVLNNCERRYNVTEKELSSIVFGCQKFRNFIFGYQITVRSDHKSISFLKRCKLGHGRLTKWLLALQEYNIEWEYVPGKRNIVADGLSRVNKEGNSTDVM